MTEEQKILEDGRAALKVLEGMDDDHVLYVPVRVLKKILRYMLGNAWKDVRDELPEEHADEHPYEFEQFLCATVWNDVRVVGFGTRIGDDKQHFWSGNSIWDDWVTHWMPMPEPPQRDEQLDLFKEAEHGDA